MGATGAAASLCRPEKQLLVILGPGLKGPPVSVLAYAELQLVAVQIFRGSLGERMDYGKWLLAVPKIGVILDVQERNHDSEMQEAVMPSLSPDGRRPTLEGKEAPRLRGSLAIDQLVLLHYFQGCLGPISVQEHRWQKSLDLELLLSRQLLSKKWRLPTVCEGVPVAVPQDWYFEPSHLRHRQSIF